MGKPELIVVDRAALLHSVDGDDDAALALIGVFLSTAKELVEELGRAIASGDRERFLASCHEIGTSLGIIGAARGERLARGIERSLRAGLTVDCEAAGLQLLDELKSVIALLQSWREWAR